MRLGIPLYGNDPELNYLGTKSGSREVFREAGIPLPDGFEHLRDQEDIAEAIVELKRRDPGLRRVAVKLDEGFSGEGNAVFNYDGAPEGMDLDRWVRDELPGRIKFEAKDETWERYCHKFEEMSGIVECWVEGESALPVGAVPHKPAGSVGRRLDSRPGAGTDGSDLPGQLLPRRRRVQPGHHGGGAEVGRVLNERGALGRFAMNISVRRGDSWEHAAIEINLRKGGTPIRT